MFCGTVESELFLEVVSALSALIGFSGHAKPHTGPLPTLPSPGPHVSAPGLSAPALLRPQQGRSPAPHSSAWPWAP